MLVVTVIVEALAMIRQQENQRTIVELGSPELAEQLAHHRVRRRHLAVVG